MTPEEIIRMAREAGFADGMAEIVGLEGFERFYKIAFAAGVAHERELCAKVCDDGGRVEIKDHYTKGMSHASRLLAAAIRARGEK